MTRAASSSVVKWSIEVVTFGDVAVAHTHAQRLAKDAGLSRKAQVEFGIAVSEAASNMIVHAGSGRLTLCAVPLSHVELEAVDAGGGIENVPAALSDGVSRGAPRPDGTPRRSLGSGLGAIARLSDALEIETSPRGTTLRARKLL